MNLTMLKFRMHAPFKIGAFTLFGQIYEKSKRSCEAVLNVTQDKHCTTGNTRFQPCCQQVSILLAFLCSLPPLPWMCDQCISLIHCIWNAVSSHSQNKGREMAERWGKSRDTQSDCLTVWWHSGTLRQILIHSCTLDTLFKPFQLPVKVCLKG